MLPRSRVLSIPAWYQPIVAAKHFGEDFMASRRLDMVVSVGRLSEYRALPGLLAKAYLLSEGLLQNLPERLVVGIRSIQ